MIDPTIGRVVLYRPDADELQHLGRAQPPNGQPLAAIISGVNSERIVNLLVADFDGRTFNRVGVLLIQDDDPPPKGGYCEWMPYQKGQAAKTEALQAQVDQTKPSSPPPQEAT